MKATLVLTNHADGLIAADFQYEGGFDTKNAAHQHMLIINKVMDTLMSRQPSGAPIDQAALDDAIKTTMATMAKKPRKPKTLSDIAK